MIHDQYLNTMPQELAVTGAAEHLRRSIRGVVIRPGDAEYDQARRVWNSRVVRHPMAVVRPRDEDDIALAVRTAREAGLPLAVRSGGHSLAGYGTVQDGVVIDLSGLTEIEIDERERVASVQPGATWGEYSRQAHGYGLATPAGDSASVGVGGLTLGGGIGWLVRKHGLAVDSLLTADVVTADGRRVTASTESHPDLFWALRGGGGNFGVVTSLRFRLHPVGTVFGGAIVYPAEAGVWRALAGAATAAPDELTIMSYAMPAPPFPFLPTEAHGAPATMILVCFAGDPGAGKRVLAPFLELGGHRPWGDMLGEMPYPDLYNLTAVGAISRPHALRAGFMKALDDDTIDAILAHGGRPSGPMSIAQLRVLGGEMARVPAGATAFTHRDKPLFLAVMNVWEPGEPEEAHVAWVDSLWRAVAPRTDGTYLNFLDDEGEERVRAAFSPEAFTRLVEVKRRYDPDNLFRHNANIRPA
jgi:FAD/FMN-containing dehydrogenase